MHIQHQFSLKHLNTFGIEALAEQFVQVHTTHELLQAIAYSKENSLRLTILGGGSNILLTGNVPGLVVKPGLKGIELLSETADTVTIRAGAGENWHKLVLHTLNQGWGGLENLSLIPGNVGTSPMQNIGAYGVELKDVFHELEALEIASGQIITFNKEQCRFGYRESYFKNEGKGRYVIVSVSFVLQKNAVPNTSYGAIQQTLHEMGIAAQPTIKDVSTAVIAIRQSKLPNPAEIGNAGSFFKNPEIPQQQYDSLKTQHPELPGYPAAAGLVKVPAGWLIEQSGWKGKRVGHAGVHAKQALVLVNYGNATGHEIWQLALKVQQSVKDSFGIGISPEVNILP